MLDSSAAQGTSAVTLLSAASCANTAAATGDAVDISEYEGFLVVTEAPLPRGRPL